MSVREGQPAPDFALTTHTNEPCNLSELRGSPVVLTVFVLSFQDDDRRQLKSFEDRSAEFKAAGAKVFALSADPSATHRAWAQRAEVTLPMVSDFRERQLREDYDIGDPESGTLKRRTFVIDKEGVVRKVVDNEDVEAHAREALDAVKGLR